MAQEIERKFLVKGDFKAEAHKATHITQGYLCSVAERTVRIRIKDDKGYITVKGIASESGVSRFEWERKFLWKMPDSCYCLPNLALSTKPAI